MRENEPKLNEYFSPKNNFPHSENINNVKKTEEINEEFENGKLTQIKRLLKNRLFENKSPSDPNLPLIDVKSNFINEKKTMNSQENEPKLNKYFSDKINEKIENSNSTLVKSKDLVSENKNHPDTNQPINYVKPHFVNEKESKNKQENEPKSNNYFSHYKNIDNVEKNENTNEERENSDPTPIKTNEKSPDSKNENLRYKKKMDFNNNDDLIKTPLEVRSIKNKYDDDDYDEGFEKNKNENSIQFMPNWLSKNKVQSNNNNIKYNSNNDNKTSEDDHKNPENEKEIKISPEEPSSKNENITNILNQNALDRKLSNDENNLLNQSLETKPLDKNNDLSDVYPSNEEYKAINPSFNELNNPGINVKSSDIENELKPNSSQNSVIENEHLNKLNSTTNNIKPNISLNSTTPQNINQEESFSKKNIANSNHTKDQSENKDKTSINNNDKTVEDKIDYLQENSSKSYDQSTVNSEIITTGFTVKSPNKSQQKMSYNNYPNQPDETNDEPTETATVDEPVTNEIAYKNQINNFSENTETAKPIGPSIKQNSQSLNFNEKDSEKVPISNDESSKATESVQYENSFSFASIYSKLFPNGIQLSNATIFGGL